MAKVVFVCENCEASDEIDLVALASYGFRLQCQKCNKEYIYKPFDDAGEKSAKEVSEMWQASLTKFTSTMIDMIYWDKKPLEDAIAARERLQKENSLLKVRLLELESQLTPRATDGALSSCWTIESAKDKDVARKVKLYIRENWQELAELLDKYCLLEAERDVSLRR